MQQIGLKPLINSYTRPTYNNIKSTSIIDQIFTNIATNFIGKLVFYYKNLLIIYQYTQILTYIKK